MGDTIAIDGPAGAGKSTIARAVAGKLGFIYVDTGAMYRAVGLYFIENNLNPGDPEEVREACGKIQITLCHENGEQQVYLNGENVSGRIRTEEVGAMASAAAKKQEVRSLLLDLQRRLAAEQNVVMDGRDIGTFVAPDAKLKIYLTASVEERARRRYLELSKKGIPCETAKIEEDIKARDEQDMNREFAPLKQAADAVLLDSSHMSIEQVEEAILQRYRERNVKQGERI